MMLPPQRRPRLQVDTNEGKPPPSSFNMTPATHERNGHLNTSIFRCQQMEIQIHSSTVKLMRRRGFEPPRSLPVFSDHDKIEGAVLLDPQVCTLPGRLTVSMEGAFSYIQPRVGDSSEDLLSSNTTEKTRHVFYSTLLTYACGDLNSPRSATSIREAFANTVRPRKMERRPSLQELSTVSRNHFPFSFDIPRPGKVGEELPPSCSTLPFGDIGVRNNSTIESAEVEYKIIAIWEGNNPTEHRRLEAPIIFQPDTDFQSLDALSIKPESWLEIPLHSDRTIPFKCAITLPDPSMFPRSATIPFFVVFTTRPRSPLLAREIAADATIAVSLLRQVTVVPRPSPARSPTSSTPYSSSSEESDGAPPTARRRLLHRVVRSAPPVFAGGLPFSDSTKKIKGDFREKPLPPLPRPSIDGFSDTRSLQTDVCIGFPKRPRHRTQPDQQHPSLSAHSSLPDGLYKGKLQLNKNMLPGMEWGGLVVKYFVEVSVLFGQDVIRARVPIRIF